MPGGRAAAKVVQKGIAKPLEKLLKECEEVAAKKAAGRGAKAASHSARSATESRVERTARNLARSRSLSRSTRAGHAYGKDAESLYGKPPPWMKNAHGHHIVYRNGGSQAKPFVEKSQELLRHFGIDPIKGRENLIWAANRNHTAANAREVLRRLTDAASSGGGRQAVEDALSRAGREVFDGWP